MRPLGSSEAPYLVPSAGSGVPLRAGAFVSLRVQGELGGGLYRVLVGGTELSALSSVPLLPGSLHRAKVEPASPGEKSLVLRLLPSPTERKAHFLASLGLPADQSSRLALAALLAEGLRPEAGSLARLRRVILRAPAGGEAERADIAAGFEAKGLGAETEAVEALASLAGGGEGSGGQGGQGGQGNPETGGKAEARQPRDQGGEEEASGANNLGGSVSEPSGAGPSGAEAPGSEAPGSEAPGAGPAPELEPIELVPALAALLRGLLSRAEEPKDGRGALLGLFNHARGRDGAFLLVPFRFALDLVAFSGSFRLHLPYIPGGPSRIEARFAVQSEEATEEWSFVLESEPGGNSRLLLGAGRPLSASDVSTLEAELAVSGCKLRIGREDGAIGTESRIAGGESEIDFDA